MPHRSKPHEELVQVWEAAVSRLSARLKISHDNRATLLLSFLAWASLVKVDWAAWTSRPWNSSEEEVRWERDRGLGALREQITRQTDLLIQGGHLRPRGREVARGGLARDFDGARDLPLLPGAVDEENILENILKKLEAECNLKPEAIQAVREELEQMMRQLQKGSSKPKGQKPPLADVRNIARHRHLTAEELAIILNLSVRKVNELARSGIIPRIKLSNRIIRFDLAKVLRVLEKLESPSIVR